MVDYRESVSAKKTTVLPANVAALYPFKSHFLNINGLRYHYLDEGKGDVIIMLHGNPTWSFYYRKMVGALRGHYRVIVPDHMGCGLSDKPDDSQYNFTLAQRVKDLEALVAHLDLGDNLTLMVHDWGGMIGMSFAARHLQSVKRLIVSNTSAFHLPKSKPLPSALRICRDTNLGSVLVRGFNAFSRAAVYICVKKKPLDRATRAGYLAPYGNWSERRAVLRFVQDIPLQPKDTSYAEVTAVEQKIPQLAKIPTLIVWGAADFVFDDHFLRDWRQNFPAAIVHRLAGVGHYVLEDAFDEVLPLVNNFLKMPTTPGEFLA